MRAVVAQIAATAYEDGSLNTPEALLDSDNPQKILDQSSILLELSSDNSAEMTAFLTAARQLANAQASARRVRDGILALKDKLAGQKASAEQADQPAAVTARPAHPGPAGRHRPRRRRPDDRHIGAPDPLPDVSQGEKAVAFAFAQIGCPYVFGGTGPCDDGYDCSGLTQAAWAAAGVAIPRTSEEQAGLPAVPESDLEPGDILEFLGDGHVGIYVGSNELIDAPQTGEDVQEVAFTGWYQENFDGAVARRPVRPAVGSPAGPPDIRRRAREGRGGGWGKGMGRAKMRAVPKVLIVSNDFPPRRGGIQSFVHALASRMPAGSVVVYAPRWEGAAEFDARQPFPVIRHPTSLMLPVPSVARRAPGSCGSTAATRSCSGRRRRSGCSRRRCAGPGPAGSSRSPTATRPAGRRCPGPDRCCAGSVTRSTCSPTWASTSGSGWHGRCPPQAAARMVRLAPGVDTASFRPGAGGDAIRERLGLDRAARWSSACRGWFRARARTR